MALEILKALKIANDICKPAPAGPGARPSVCQPGGTARDNAAKGRGYLGFSEQPPRWKKRSNLLRAVARSTWWAVVRSPAMEKKIESIAGTKLRTATTWKEDPRWEKKIESIAGLVRVAAYLLGGDVRDGKKIESIAVDAPDRVARAFE